MDSAKATTAAVQVMTNLGLVPDPWQLDVLHSQHPRLLLNCCRQAGKSTIVAVDALFQAMYSKDLLVLLISRSHRQSNELFGVLRRIYERAGSPLRQRQSARELALKSGSRIISLPCKEETIRGFANVGLLIIDEAARVPDGLYQAVRPMLAVSRGRLVCMSTPHGKRGFFYEAWAHGGNDWKRVTVRADQVSRISPAFLDEERRCLGESFFRQEYQCSFEALEGLVYPGLAGCEVQLPSGENAAAGKPVGGIDFGYNSPFAAIWGVLAADDVLWLTDEHYHRGRPLSWHAAALPRNVLWHCDPAGANERAELRCAGFIAVQAKNQIRTGIAAVSARIQSGRLRIAAGRCPNLLHEAGLYCYDPRRPNDEIPVDEHNHALDALRYLVCGLDGRRLAKRPAQPNQPPAPTDSLDASPKEPWLHVNNEHLWTS